MSTTPKTYEEHAKLCLYRAEQAMDKGLAYELSMYWLSRAQVYATLATVNQF